MEAAIEAITRVLRKGTVDTRPEEDAERIAAAARRHRVPARVLTSAAEDIADFSRRPETPLGRVVFRTWGDMGAGVLRSAAAEIET